MLPFNIYLYECQFRARNNLVRIAIYEWKSTLYIDAPTYDELTISYFLTLHV